MRVYVAGPYTKGDTALNVRRAIGVGDELMDAGHFPFVPHLSHFQHMLCPRPYEDWMANDLVWLPQCEALVRLRGESPGADREVKMANDLKIPVYGSVAEFLAARD